MLLMFRNDLLFQAKPLLDTNNVKGIADPRLGEEYDHTEMMRLMVTASMCVHHASSKRPFMNKVRLEDDHITCLSFRVYDLLFMI